jgi:hypothetical protein
MDKWQELWGQMQTAKAPDNRFNGYQDQFGYDDMKGSLDRLYGNQYSNISKTFSQAGNQAKGDAASRLAGSGITSGFMLEDSMERANNNTIAQKGNALTQLGLGRQGQETGLMNTANNNKFRNTQMAQHADMQKIMAEMQKLGMMGSYLGNWENMEMQKANQPGLLEDIFSGLGQVAGIATGGGGLIGKALGLFKD